MKSLVLCCATLFVCVYSQHVHEDSHKDGFELFVKELNRSSELLVSDLFNISHRVFDNLGCEGSCSKCLHNVSVVIGSNGTTVNEDQFLDFSIVLLHYARNATGTCTSSPNPSADVSVYVNHLMTDHGVLLTSFTEHMLEHVFDDMNRTYSPSNHDHDHDHEHENEHSEETKCFSPASIFHDAGLEGKDATPQKLGIIASLVVYSLYEGQKIGSCPSKNEALQKLFKGNLFHLLGIEENKTTLTSAEFERLLSALKIGSTSSKVETVKDEHEGHNHKRSIRMKREAGHEEEFKDVSKCFSGDDLMTTYGIDKSVGVTYPQLQVMAPTLLQQQIGNYCVASATNQTASCGKLSLGEICGYGILAVFIISAFSFIGLVLIPCISSSIFESLMITFIALAVGTMSGDALLHLMPQALGLHVHESGPSCNRTVASSLNIHVESFVWLQLCVIAALYVFFVIETAVALFRSGKVDDHSGHGHSHIPDAVMLENVSNAANGEAKSMKSVDTTKSTADLTKSDVTSITRDRADEPTRVISSENKVKGLPLLALMIVLGDGIHNFADGMAIGAAFTQGARSGISTSIAVFCHEVPHEFGDFAAMVSTGIGYKKALLLNFLSSLTAFAGLFLGVFISVNDTARQWIFAVTAGMFLYISLANMLPELVKLFGKTRSKRKTFIFQHVGILIGYIIMLLIAVFEEHIVV